MRIPLGIKKVDRIPSKISKEFEIRVDLGPRLPHSVGISSRLLIIRRAWLQALTSGKEEKLDRYEGLKTEAGFGGPPIQEWFGRGETTLSQPQGGASTQIEGKRQ